jgi:hypothetical protein
MALRAVPDHPKFAQLKSCLNQPKGAVLGWLESMWHFTGRFTPHGNIGKYTDAAIESWVEWDGEAGALVAALVSSGWVDASGEFRLVVHDWHLHADNATKLSVKRSGKPFCFDFVATNIDSVSTHIDSVATKSEKPRQCVHKVEETPTVWRLPVPVPEPVPEPVHKNKQIPSRIKTASGLKPVDPRFTPFRESFFSHNLATTQAEPSWGGRQAKVLATYLAETPGITLVQWEQILENRARSDIPQGEPLSAWIDRARMFYKEPLDRFGKPMSTGGNNGTFKGKTESSIDAAHEALAIIRARGQADRDSATAHEAGHTPAGEAGHGRLLGAG